MQKVFRTAIIGMVGVWWDKELGKTTDGELRAGHLIMWADAI